MTFGMSNPLATLRRLTHQERVKCAILTSWFFVMITNLWLLKPIRQASLLAHLGAAELPYVRFGAVIAVALVVAVYSRIVDRLTRMQVARGSNILFATLLLALWFALRIGGEALGGQRWFVWLVFILVDIYSVVMVGIFWTYTNDVCTREEADKLYGPIGLGGIVGGLAGGILVDTTVRLIGQVDILLICVALSVASALIVTRAEPLVHAQPRPLRAKTRGSALDGAKLVVHSRYLLLIVGIVVGYEFAAAMTDFVVSVVFERAYPDQATLAKMFGRVGWIVSGVALLSQLLLVPALLPRKRVALLVPPIVMGIATVGMAIVPVAVMAIVMTASDRGLNYSLQQAAKETLYVPLTDAEKYKAKAFIDMLVDRGAKAMSSVALMIVLAASGLSIVISLAVALAALAAWTACAALLGRAYAKRHVQRMTRTPAALNLPDRGPASA